MLLEVTDLRQIPGDPRRRWFNSEHLDLFIWYDPQDQPIGFQLCYGKPEHERALTWWSPELFSHMRVKAEGRYPAPILVPDGVFDAPRVAEIFEKESRDLPRALVEMVQERLLQYPAGEEMPPV